MRLLAGTNVRYAPYTYDLLHLDIFKLLKKHDKNSFLPKQLIYININLLYENLFLYPKTHRFLKDFSLLFNDSPVPFVY